jgi:hypothetical protein
MKFAELISNWCGLSYDTHIVIVTDGDRLDLASYIQEQIGHKCRIIDVYWSEDYYERLLSLTPSDLVIALFSLKAFMRKEISQKFQPFEKPIGLKAKYAFIRLDITKESLLQGLFTPRERVYSTIDKLSSLPQGTQLRVTTRTGTDVTLRIKGFTTCSHSISVDGGMAFLPPSEITTGVIPSTANGRIVVDVTVGQLYKHGELLGYFGLVDSPVTLIVENGKVIAVTGGTIAAELRLALFRLESDCRVLVELGHGLSTMTPTGLIGVDESIIDTCHFGIGDASTCGMHLDVVLSGPTIARAG